MIGECTSMIDTAAILETVEHAVRVTEIESKNTGIKGKEKLNHAISLIKFLVPKFALEISLLEALVEGVLKVMKIIGDIESRKE